MADAQIRAVISADDRASAVLRKFGNQVDSTQTPIGKLGAAAAQFGKIAVAAFAAAGAAAAVFGVKTAASLETSRQGFLTLLGSAEKADKTMARIKKEAARTPFEIAGLTQVTQLLTSVTKDGDRALDFVLDIGEGLAAMGRGQAELDRIAVNIQQIAATGRAFGIDIRQFAFAGIPIYEMLQEEIGLTGEALQEFIEEGGVTFELLEKMFGRATEAGGRWHGAFQNQAGSFNQLVANMKDSFAILASDIIVKTGAFDFLKRGILFLTEVVNGNNASFNRMRETIGKLWAFVKPAFMDLWNVIRTQLIPQLVRFIKLLQPELTTALKIMGAVALVTFKAYIQGLAHILRIGSKVLEVMNAIIERTKGAVQRGRDFFGDIAAKIPGIGNIGARQHGGPVMANQPYLVGEKGPEVVVPSQSGTVVPNSGIGGNITINIQAGAFMGSRLEARKFAQMVIDDMKDIAGAKNMSINQMLGA